MTNTSQYIPYDSVSPIILETSGDCEYPFFGGTGFFVQLPPYDHIFFITAKHCVLDYKNIPKGTVKISYESTPTCRKVVIFYDYLLSVSADHDEDFEDLIIYLVGETLPEKREILRNRCLQLQHQDDIDSLIDHLIEIKGNVRTVGFPSTSKKINYDDRQAVARPRGFYGTLTSRSEDGNLCTVESLSWREGSLEGFSGSPVLELLPNHDGKIVPIVIGVLLMGSSQIMRFLSINVATNLIASYLQQV